MVHEFAHAIDQFGARFVIPGFMERLAAVYNKAVEDGRYKDTYMGSNFNEYWVSYCRDGYHKGNFLSQG